LIFHLLLYPTIHLSIPREALSCPSPPTRTQTPLPANPPENPRNLRQQFSTPSRDDLPEPVQLCLIEIALIHGAGKAPEEPPSMQDRRRAAENPAFPPNPDPQPIPARGNQNSPKNHHYPQTSLTPVATSIIPTTYAAAVCHSRQLHKQLKLNSLHSEQSPDPQTGLKPRPPPGACVTLCH
jgi:hypothetical protein